MLYSIHHKQSKQSVQLYLLFLPLYKNLISSLVISHTLSQEVVMVLYSYFILSLFLSFVNTIFTHSKYRNIRETKETEGGGAGFFLAYLIILFYN